MSRVKLGELKPGQGGRILKVEGEFCARLMEMGLLEDSTVKVLHEAPFGGDPIVVKVRGTLLALRRGEANEVWVET